MPDENPLAGAQPGDTYLVTFPSGSTTKLLIIALDDEDWVAWDYCLYTSVEDFPHYEGVWCRSTYEKVEQ